MTEKQHPFFRVGDRVVVNDSVVPSWSERIGWTGTIKAIWETSERESWLVLVTYDSIHPIWEATHNARSLSCRGAQAPAYMKEDQTEYYSAITADIEKI